MPKVSSSQGLPEGNLEDSLWKLVLAPGPSKLKLIKKLIDAGVNVNKRARGGGETCLSIAVARKRYKLVQMLLDAGADPNRCSRKKWINNAKYESPLYRSLDLADRKLFYMLLEAGAKVKYLKRTEFINIMFNAIQKGRPKCAEVLELFLQNGADINYTGDDGCHQTLLFEAASRNRLHIVELLLEWGADPNIPSRFDRATPIFITTFLETQDARCAELLIAGGADINWKNRMGSPLLHIAIGGQNRSLVDCLVKHIALLKSAGKFVEPSNIAPIIHSAELTEFFRECTSELQSMKRISLTRLVSYFDVLADNNKLKRCARDVSLSDSLERDNMIRNFPIYGEYMSDCLDRERDRAMLEDRAVIGLSQIFKINLRGQPLILRQIFKHLRKPDLRSVYNCLSISN